MAMAMLEKKKTGGPYPKDERVKRQNEVSRLHFEYGYSATKISSMMKVNRNTINQDIKSLYSEIKEELKENSEDLILKQIGRLEAQRSRIAENIQVVKDSKFSYGTPEKIRYEKILLDIDSKINDMLARINSDGTVNSPTEFKISPEQIRDFVLFLLIKYSQNPSIKKEEILCEILNIFQCGTQEAEKIFLHIEELGLGYCKKFNGDAFVFDILEFTFLRRYLLSNDPFVGKIHALCILKNQFDAEKSILRKNFKKRYGDKKSWSDDIFTEYQKEHEKVSDKYAESSGKIVVDALENFSDKNGIEKYLHCINLFFAKEDKSLINKILDL